MENFKLGKKPPTYDKRDLRFENYLIALPKPPAQFGHEKFIGSTAWGMLGNDTVGDCTVAGADHEQMLWASEGQKAASFTTANTIGDYSAITGYNPNDPNSDQGADVRDVLKYRAKTGLVDAKKSRHKIGAYVALQPGNLSHLYAAMYLFGAVGIGIEFPASAMDQFNAGKVWSVVSRSPIEGGHYVPLVARRSHLICVTWSQIQPMTTAFYQKYCDEAWVALSPEMLASGKSPEGFNLAQLQADLKAI